MAFVPLNDDTPLDQYVATAAQTTFAYTWLAFAEADIKVYVNGVLKTLTTDYTVSAVNQENGANVVFNSGLSLDDAVTITRDIAIARTTGYTTSGSFRAETLNIEQNKELAIAQQLERDLGRTVRLSAFSTIDGANLVLPTPTDGYAILWDGTDGSLRNTTASLSVLEGNAATVAGNIANVNIVAGISANVTTVAGIAANVTTVAGISGDVTAVAGIAADVSAVENIAANVTTVAGINSDVTAVSGITADVTAVAGIAADVSAVENIAANVTTVAGINSDVTAVAGISANVTTVAGISANVTTVAGISADVTTVATNVADVSSFANIYRIAASDPGTSLDEGDLVYNTTDNALKYYNGSSWQSIAPGISDVVSDTTPQLGGSLDVNGNKIVSVSNGNIDIEPDGTGNVLLGNFIFDADQTVGAGQDNYVVTYDDATGLLSLEEAAGGGAWNLISETTLSGDSVWAPVSEITSTYKEYVIKVINLVPAADGGSLYLRCGTDNTSLDSGTGNYRYSAGGEDDGGNPWGDGNASRTQMQLTGSQGLGNASGEGCNFTIHVWNPSGTTTNTFFNWNGTFTDDGGVGHSVEGQGRRVANSAVDIVGILSNGGNLASGTIKLYGVS
jgi:hypothetical protein